MMIVGIAAGILIGILWLYWFLVHPRRSGNQGLEPYRRVYIAHRGLYNNQSEAPENTIAAFRKAVRSGYGIELDVQLTQDGQVVVAHDSRLNRVTGRNGKIQDYTYRELQQFSVFGTEERIPLFSRVLCEVAGKTPLIVEIKAGADYKELCEKTAGLLDQYTGEFCVESFSPLAVKWFRDNRPQWIRGQLSTNYRKDRLSRKWYVNFFLGGFLLNFLGRPDFLACNHKYAKELRFRLLRRFSKGCMAAWTVKTQQELEQAEKYFDIFIFDSFIPNGFPGERENENNMCRKD